MTNIAIFAIMLPNIQFRVILDKEVYMKGASIADAALMNTEELYKIIDQLSAENQNLKTENRLLKVMLGE